MNRKQGIMTLLVPFKCVVIDGPTPISIRKRGSGRHPERTHILFCASGHWTDRTPIWKWWELSPVKRVQYEFCEVFDDSHLCLLSLVDESEYREGKRDVSYADAHPNLLHIDEIEWLEQKGFISIEWKSEGWFEAKHFPDGI